MIRSPLRGRAAEQNAARALVTAAEADSGDALLVRGEPGIGKTALLDDTAAHARREHPGCRVLRCTGVESDIALAFGGLHALLAPLLPHGADALRPDQRAALDSALGLSERPAGELVVRTAVLDLLTAAGPVLLAVDDVQWLDPATRSVLFFAARRLTGRPVSVLLGLRTEAGAPNRPAPPRDLRTLDLPPLAPADAAALLAARGLAPDGPGVTALLAASGGNPLALAELPVPDAPFTGPYPVDGRLREAFAHRARAQPAPVRAILLAAAADDRGDTDVVRAAAAALGAEDPEAALGAAERAGLLRVTGPAVRFGHPLVRSAVYADAASPDRAAAHRAVADALTARGAREHALWHRALARTGPDEPLAAELERAADAAAGRGGMAAVAAALARAAELSGDERARTRRLAAAAHAAWKSGHPAAARELTARAAPPEDAAPLPELARMRAYLEYSAGDQESAHRQLAETAREVPPATSAALLFMACDAAEHAGRADALRENALRIAESAVEPEYRRYGRLLAAAYDGDHREYGGDPWELLRRAPRDLGTSRVHRWLWPTAIGRDGPDPQRARRFAQEAAERIRTAGSPALLQQPLLWLAELEWETGRFEAAREHADEALRLARDLDHPVRSADALALLAKVAAVDGDAASCRAYAAEAVTAALPLNNRAAAADAAWAMAIAALAEGDHATALERLEPVRTTGSPSGHPRLARRTAADLVEAYTATGATGEAASATGEFGAWADGAGLPWARSQAALCRALTAEAERSDEGSRRAEREGSDLYGLHDTEVAPGLADRPFLRARAALLYGERLRRARRPADARPLLRLAADLFEGIGAPVWRDRARGELRAAGASARRTGEEAGGLTAQEAQVARLAAEGLSNREIGTRLGVSPRTVGYHLYKIFPKLGITGRGELRDVRLPDA
ncbi:AAA family ATPase [Streptomyces sp. NPDC050504]|uniref:helix-turn-helix transcriptional regulator n=1 Tax=Streptomyces sp. NPDC050504 TaxID=3365618 RepID=UPI0037B27637